jgi:adsorption protein B
MGVGQAAVDTVLREAMLFAAIGLLIGGLDDLLVDLLFVIRRIGRRHRPIWSVAALRPAQAGRIVVFVPAWDEQAVIGTMLARALERYRHPNYRIHVGLYPNDPGTIAAVVAIAAQDARVRAVIGEMPGPTTKAACLNTLWHDLTASGAVADTHAIALHDAEDLVHPDELTVFDALIGDHAVVQLPVMPLVKPGSPFVSGHYLDEFAEAA